MEVPIIYRDEALVAVDKPSGMLVHRSPGARDPIVVMMHVRDLVGRHTFPVHRLDRATSGVVIVAIEAEAARRLSKAFLQGRVEKTYLAIVAGCAPEHGSIETPLEKKEGVWQEAVTEFTRRSTREGWSLLDVRPRQGRRHQIRRHLSGAGFPLAGDALHGDEEVNRRARLELGIERLALHALRLRLLHPITRAPLDLVAPVPPGLTLS
jgi:tRNA pseudouridine65 synthase